jgi:hypothetical protein
MRHGRCGLQHHGHVACSRRIPIPAGTARRALRASRKAERCIRNGNRGAALLNDPDIGALRIDVNTAGGVVTLSGDVKSKAEADRDPGGSHDPGRQGCEIFPEDRQFGAHAIEYGLRNL